jgi:hypothetical protein
MGIGRLFLTKGRQVQNTAIANQTKPPEAQTKINDPEMIYVFGVFEF